jgi:predicted dehydrogenase
MGPEPNSTRRIPGLKIEGHPSDFLRTYVLKAVSFKKLVALVSRNLEKPGDWLRSNGIPSTCDSPDKCLANRIVEAVFITTPPGKHLRESGRFRKLSRG